MEKQKFNVNLYLFLTDAFLVFASLIVAFGLRFDFSIPKQFMDILISWIVPFIVGHSITFYLSGMYDRIWRYTSLFDLYAIFRSVFLSFCTSYAYVFTTIGPSGYPRSVLLLYPLFLMLFSSIIRLGIRVYYSHYHESSLLKINSNSKKLILIGAGKTGEKIAREILTTSRINYKLVGFVDDDIEKQGSLIHGKKIFCGIDKLPNLNLSYDELLITAPSANGDQMRRIVKYCKETGKRYKTVPSMSEIFNEEVNLAAIRDVSYSDLLGRQEVTLDMNSIDNLLQGKRVLITGAGGSIGSELVKQCLIFKPAEIICLDNAEEKIYNLEQSDFFRSSSTIIKNILGSITSFKEVEKIFIENRPQIVFHAAAYKHVPIQELHPWTAVNTNLGGTYNLVSLSDKFKVKKFVLVSTDKAVNPVNVMGATKRAAEKLIQSYNAISKTAYMAVRFGNVLGSSGSAIPTFQKQINSGGPLTVTHPEMTRYFMSIPEATQLILQCGVYGKNREIFVLEMGKPIKILQMAKDLIRLSGFEPEVDIPIVFTGLRPGEKLYEELQMHNERKVRTSHEKIMVLEKPMSYIPWEVFKKDIINLLRAAENLDGDRIQLILKNIIPTYKPGNLKLKIKENNISFDIKAEA